MNQLPGNGDGSFPPFLPIQFPPGFEVCWAGPHPFRVGLCFASVDGRILFTDEEGGPLMNPGKGSASGEAINGVACIETWVAITTRQEVTFLPLPGTKEGHGFGAAFPHGAHGITTTQSGYFIAPLGRTGIMAVKPPFRPGSSITVHSPEGNNLYAYRVISLRSHAGVEMLICAARVGGIAFGEFSGSRQTHTMTTARFKGLDVVDICPLRANIDTLAVAALGRDGSLVLLQDVLHDKAPITMKFQKVQGIAYRLLTCRGDIYVLTSKGIYVLGKLASRFLKKDLFSGVITPVLPLAMKAVDANLAGDRWLLVVMRDEVRRFDADLIHQSIPDENQEAQETILSPDWKWEALGQMKMQLEAVG